MTAERSERDDNPGLVPTLREFALLADGERGALIGPDGRVCWMCVPSWADDAVFSTLIGGAGSYSVTPATAFTWGGYYEDRSLIWHSRWVTRAGVAECREALALPGRRHRAVLLRRILGVEGTVPVRVTLDPRPGFGRRAVAGLRQDGLDGPDGPDGVEAWCGRVGELELRWSGRLAAVARIDHDAGGGSLVAERLVRAGDCLDLVLELGELPADRPVPDVLWAETKRAWRSAVPELPSLAGVRDAQHAVAVLRGLTGGGHGMVAAASISLPERARQGRDYDYRYVWIRDQCYAGLAAARAGLDGLLDDAVTFVTERLLADGPNLRPAYTARGGPIPDERRLDLPGYPGGDDVVGNKVGHQFQLDVFGEAALLLAAAARRGRLTDDARRAAAVTAGVIAARWRIPDTGVWELEPRHWTHSRLTCAAGLLALAGVDGAGVGEADGWRALARRLLSAAREEMRHSSGRWQRATDDPRVDAALLLPAVRGAVDVRDPVSVATLRAVAEQLTDDGYVYRFDHAGIRLGVAEGAFLLCGFWLALAYHRAGRHDQARRYFERGRAACGPPGIYAEEFDVTQRQLRGNIPQAFVHALVLETAATLRPLDGTDPG